LLSVRCAGFSPALFRSGPPCQHAELRGGVLKWRRPSISLRTPCNALPPLGGLQTLSGGVPVPSNRLYFTPQPSRQYRNGGGGLRSSPFTRSPPPPVPDPPRSTLGPMDPMPQPGDLIDAFSPQPGRCFRMVQLVQLQATHCYEPPAWKGIWRDRPDAVSTSRRAGSTPPRRPSATSARNSVV
jgi:hypothetical protein